MVSSVKNNKKVNNSKKGKKAKTPFRNKDIIDSSLKEDISLFGLKEYIPMPITAFHIYDRPWPVDPKFFGQGFVIANYASESPKLSVISIKVRSFHVHNKEELDIEKKVAREFFSTDYKGSTENPYEILKYMRDFEINEELKKGRNVVVIFHTTKNLDFAKGLKRKYGKKVKTIFYMHCKPDVYGFVDKGEKTNKGKAFSSIPFDAYIAVSKAVKEEFINYGLVKSGMIEVIRNGISADIYSPIDPSLRDEVRHELGLNDNYVIAYSGRITKNKGRDIILELMRIVNNKLVKDPNNALINKLAFLFALSGGREKIDFIKEIYKFSYLVNNNKIKIILDLAKYTNNKRASHNVKNLIKDYLTKDINSLKVDDKKIIDTLFNGPIDVPIQSISDVFIQPSFSEAFSLTVLESLAVNTPVITLSSGGPTELISSLGGYLIAPLYLSTDELFYGQYVFIRRNNSFFVNGIPTIKTIQEDGITTVPADQIKPIADVFFKGINVIYNRYHNYILKDLDITVKAASLTARHMAESLNQTIMMLFNNETL